MAGRRSFKSDDSFLEKLAIGACGTRKVIEHLAHLRLDPIELERGSTSYKLWKAIKIKRIRVPDVLCLANGVRVECRAKTKLLISMSHSQADPTRGWDHGLVDDDYVALVRCSRSGDEPVDWQAVDPVQYTKVSALRRAYDAAHVIEERPKGAQEGFELRLTWPAAVASCAGVVKQVTDRRIQFRRSTDGRTISLALVKQGIALTPLLGEESAFEAGRILAAVTPVLLEVPLGDAVDAQYYIGQLGSMSLEDRYTAAKALSHVPTEETPAELVTRLDDDSEHIYVQMESAACLARRGVSRGNDFIHAAIRSEYLQYRLEAVIILSEIDTAESKLLLRETLSDSEQDAEIRAAAAWSLGELSHGEAVDDLILAFHGVPDVIRVEAARALAKITRENVAPVLDAYAAAPEVARPGVAWALSRLDHVHLADLLAHTPADSVDARHWTTFVLGSVQQEKIIGDIEQLQADDPQVYFAVTLLWKIMSNWVFDLKEFG